MKKDDPCVSVCRFDGRTGWCSACGRTIPETRAWRKLTPFRRAALLRELPRRVLQLQETAASETTEHTPVKAGRKRP